MPSSLIIHRHPRSDLWRHLWPSVREPQVYWVYLLSVEFPCLSVAVNLFTNIKHSCFLQGHRLSRGRQELQNIGHAFSPGCRNVQKALENKRSKAYDLWILLSGTMSYLNRIDVLHVYLYVYFSTRFHSLP